MTDQPTDPKTEPNPSAAQENEADGAASTTEEHVYAPIPEPWAEKVQPPEEVNLSDEELDKVAREVAEALQETEERAVDQIRLLLARMGPDFLWDNVRHTQEIEEQGGLPTHDGKRRRTPGGVFFFVVKGKMEEDLIQEIFPKYGMSRRNFALEWEKRAEIIQPLLNDKEAVGQVSEAQLTLRGRVREAYVHDQTVVIVMEQRIKKFPVPAGVPRRAGDVTQFVVFAPLEQWQDVQEEAREGKELLIFDGVPYHDKEMQQLTLLTRRITTRTRIKARQAEKRQQQKSQGGKGKPQDKQQGGKGKAKAQAEKGPQKGKPQDKNKGKAQAKNRDAAPAQAQPAQPAKGQSPEKQSPKEQSPAKQSPKGHSPEKQSPAKPAASAKPTNVGDNKQASEKLTQLRQAAAKLRERLAAMEARNETSGADITRKLLQNTERQIAALEKKQ